MLGKCLISQITKVVLLTVIAIFQLLPLSTHATMITQTLHMDGGQEVGAGDPDGTAVGTISFNDETGLISWNFLYFNIAAPTAMHIHGPNGASGLNAPVFIGLGVNTSGGAGTLIDSLIADVSDVSMIINNPGDFYINIHNAEFLAGAVRGQIPVPATLLLLGLGVMALGFKRINY